MLEGQYIIVKITKDNKREIVERNVSNGLASLMDAAGRHGGQVLTPRLVTPTRYVVLDELGNRFAAE
jgi:hypothetical protein